LEDKEDSVLKTKQTIVSSTRVLARSTVADPVGPDRILLGRLALLSREGNSAAVRRLLAEWWERESQSDDRSEWDTGVRGPRTTDTTNPLFLPIVELPNLDERLITHLENSLGVIHVIDLERWRTEDIAEVPGIGSKMLEQLRAALEQVGAWKLLQRRQRMYRKGSFSELIEATHPFDKAHG
jgi:hypothetical protein